MAGIPGFDAVRQALGGLFGAQQQAAPAAPAGAGGVPGMAPPPPPPAPAQPGLLDTRGAAGPEDLSDIGPLRALALTLGNFSAGVTGGPRPSDMLEERRHAQNQARQQAYQQAVDAAQKFATDLDNTPQSDYQAKYDLYRKRFSVLAGTGGGEMFDTLVGKPGAWLGNIKAFETDPYMQALKENPDATPKMFKDRSLSPEHQAIVANLNDEQWLQSGLQKIARQGVSTNPDYLVRRGELASNGAVTLDQQLSLQDAFNEPDRLTHSEAEALRRHPERLVGVPGIRTPEQQLKRQDEQTKADVAEASALRLQNDRQAGDLEKQRLANQGALDVANAKANQPPKPLVARPPSAAQAYSAAKGIIQQRQKYLEPQLKIQAILNKAQSGIVDYVTLMSVIHNIDDTAAREGEVATAQSAASLTQRMTRWVSNKQSGRLLDPTAYKELRGFLSSALDISKKLDRNFIKQSIPAFAGSFGKQAADLQLPGWRDGFTPEEQDAILNPKVGGNAPGAAPARWQDDPRAEALRQQRRSNAITPDQFMQEMQKLKNDFGKKTSSSVQPQAIDQGMVQRVATEVGVDPSLLMAIAQQESAGDPNAVSGKGARGLMQLMPDTARSLGVTDANNPEQSLRAGGRYLKQQLQRFNGNIDLALAAYNAGPGAVEKHGGVPPYPETRNYVTKVRERARKPKRVGM